MTHPTTPHPFWQRVFFERLMRVDYSTTPTKAREELAALYGYADGLLFANVINIQKHQDFFNLIKESQAANTAKEAA